MTQLRVLSSTETYCPTCHGEGKIPNTDDAMRLAALAEQLNIRKQQKIERQAAHTELLKRVFDYVLFFGVGLSFPLLVPLIMLQLWTKVGAWCEYLLPGSGFIPDAITLHHVLCWGLGLGSFALLIWFLPPVIDYDSAPSNGMLWSPKRRRHERKRNQP